MLVIGLTGSIATGKSTVAKMLAKQGVTVIDSDQIVRGLQQPGEIVYEEIIKEFGTEILMPDEQINRSELAKLIFNDQSLRKKLEKIVHPHVRAKIISELNICDDELVIVDIPLLFEVGFDDLVESVILVYTNKELQLERLQKRDGGTLASNMSKIDAQMPIDMKLSMSDYIIDNNSTLVELKERTQEILKIIKDEGDLNV